MNFRRKIDSALLAWKHSHDHLPLVVTGLRQCGKTHSVLKFAREHYKHVVYANFIKTPALTQAFVSTLDVDRITWMMSALLPEPIHFEPGNTVFVFDELQQCPQARTALKFFKIDGRYDVIAIAPWLEADAATASIPVGYETHRTMRALDFEEFLWANNFPQEAIALLRESFRSQQPVPEPLLTRLHELFLQYVVVGGLPAVVKTFLVTHNIDRVRQCQQDLLNDCRCSLIQAAHGSDKVRVRECFDALARQLIKTNSKFQYAMLRQGARSSQYRRAIALLENAGLVVRSTSVTEPRLPLAAFARAHLFKLYVADCGLFMAMLDKAAAAAVLTGDLTGHNGAVVEAAAADVLSKMGRTLCYFHKDSGLAMDFVIRYQGQCVPLLVKTTDGNTKALKNIVRQQHITRAIRAGRTHVGSSGPILTIPLSMLFLLTEH